MTPPAFPLMGTLCHNNHPMRMQRDGNLYEIDSDQSVRTLEGGAHVDYEHVGCSNDCPQIPLPITSFAFEIVANGAQCDCEAANSHARDCAYFRPQSTATITLTIEQDSSARGTFTFNAEHADTGQRIIETIEQTYQETDGSLDEISELLMSKYGWFTTPVTETDA